MWAIFGGDISLVAVILETGSVDVNAQSKVFLNCPFSSLIEIPPVINLIISYNRVV
jgi:hypothetical protein